MSNVNITDYRDHVIGRASYPRYTEKNLETAFALDRSHEAFHTALKGFMNETTPAGEAVKAAYEKVTQSRAVLEDVATFQNESWIPKKDVASEAFKKAHEDYKAADEKISKFLTGEEKLGEAEVTPALKELFAKAKEATRVVRNTMEGMFGSVKVDGFKETLSHNANTLKIWSKEAPKTAKSTIAFRSVGLVTAGAAITDAVLRGKDKQGEDRGFVARGAELLAGVGVGVGALTLGAAR